MTGLGEDLSETKHESELRRAEDNSSPPAGLGRVEVVRNEMRQPEQGNQGQGSTAGRRVAAACLASEPLRASFSGSGSSPLTQAAATRL
jgi:hypothetical protein